MGCIFRNIFRRSSLTGRKRRLFTHHFTKPVQHFCPLFVREFHYIRTAFKNALKQVGLQLNAGEYLFFNAVFGDQIYYINAAAFLADSVNTADTLVHAGRIPGKFKIDHTIGCLQV